MVYGKLLKWKCHYGHLWYDVIILVLNLVEAGTCCTQAPWYTTRAGEGMDNESFKGEGSMACALISFLPPNPFPDNIGSFTIGYVLYPLKNYLHSWCRSSNMILPPFHLVYDVHTHVILPYIMVFTPPNIPIMSMTGDILLVIHAGFLLHWYAL